MNEKEIRKLLDEIECTEFNNSDTYWIVRAQLITALSVRELSDSIGNALPLAGKGY